VPVRLVGTGICERWRLPQGECARMLASGGLIAKAKGFSLIELLLVVAGHFDYLRGLQFQLSSFPHALPIDASAVSASRRMLPRGTSLSH